MVVQNSRTTFARRQSLFRSEPIYVVYVCLEPSMQVIFQLATLQTTALNNRYPAVKSTRTLNAPGVRGLSWHITCAQRIHFHMHLDGIQNLTACMMRALCFRQPHQPGPASIYYACTCLLLHQHRPYQAVTKSGISASCKACCSPQCAVCSELPTMFQNSVAKKILRVSFSADLLYVSGCVLQPVYSFHVF